MFMRMKCIHYYSCECYSTTLDVLIKIFKGLLTNQIDVVINCTPICVKIKSKLINLMKITRIEGYNGKYVSNPPGIREISDDLFEFHQII